MVSGLVVALTMIGICVVAPTAITLTTTTIVKKSKAKGNALKAETALRKAAKSSEKNPSKEKKLVKRSTQVINKCVFIFLFFLLFVFI